MSTHSSDFDDLSEYSGHSFDTAETQSIDTVDELLQRFTLEARPDCTLKLRNRHADAVDRVAGSAFGVPATIVHQAACPASTMREVASVFVALLQVRTCCAGC